MRAVRKIAKTEELMSTESEGSWAISYGDMITLLLTFFILFFSTDKSKPEQKEKQETVKKTEEKAVSPTKEDRAFEELSLVLTGKALQTLKTPDRNISSIPSTESVKDFKNASVKTAESGNLSIKLYQIGGQLIIEFPGVSFFEFGQTELTPSALEALNKFSETFKNFEGKFVVGIRAFTDDRPVRWGKLSRYRDNWELSALRAISTMHHLNERGIPLPLLRIGGYGEVNATSNQLLGATEDQSVGIGNALDRKVVLVLELKPNTEQASSMPIESSGGFPTTKPVSIPDTSGVSLPPTGPASGPAPASVKEGG